MPRTGDYPPGVTDADIGPEDRNYYCSVCGDCVVCGSPTGRLEFTTVNQYGEVECQCSAKCWERTKWEQEDDDE